MQTIGMNFYAVLLAFVFIYLACLYIAPALIWYLYFFSINFHTFNHEVHTNCSPLSRWKQALKNYIKLYKHGPIKHLIFVWPCSCMQVKSNLCLNVAGKKLCNINQCDTHTRDSLYMLDDR